MDATEKRERLVAAATALLAAAPGKRLNIVSLNKALFYLDLVALRDTGHAVTHNTFLALRWGPVVAKYATRLVKELESRGVAVQEIDDNELARPLRLTEEPGEDHFIPQAIKPRIREIVRFLSAKSSTAVSDLSHDNVAWQDAFERGAGGGGKPAPINMLVAMQQIVGHDPWLDEPPQDQDNTRYDTADDDRGEEW